jgi:hypothetical protein
VHFLAHVLAVHFLACALFSLCTFFSVLPNGAVHVSTCAIFSEHFLQHSADDDGHIASLTEITP